MYTDDVAKQRTLQNSPIREALLDIRVTLPPEFDLRSLENYHESIKATYPIKQVNTQIEAAIKVEKGQRATVSSTGKRNGYIFKTQINDRIIQFRGDGFTFNKLKPYTNWEKFSGEARHHWENYLNITKIKLVNRIALRYIDVIRIPIPFKDFKEYILTAPEIAPDLPQGLNEFFARLVIPEDSKTNNVAIVTETIDVEERNKNATMLPIIFDTDVFNQTNIEANTSLIWEMFDKIRKYKNRIFFESLTEKAIKLFEP